MFSLPAGVEVPKRWRQCGNRHCKNTFIKTVDASHSEEGDFCAKCRKSPKKLFQNNRSRPGRLSTPPFRSEHEEEEEEEEEQEEENASDVDIDSSPSSTHWKSNQNFNSNKASNSKQDADMINISDSASGAEDLIKVFHRTNMQKNQPQSKGTNSKETESESNTNEQQKRFCSHRDCGKPHPKTDFQGNRRHCFRHYPLKLADNGKSEIMTRVNRNDPSTFADTQKILGDENISKLRTRNRQPEMADTDNNDANSLFGEGSEEEQDSPPAKEPPSRSQPGLEKTARNVIATAPLLHPNVEEQVIEEHADEEAGSIRANRPSRTRSNSPAKTPSTTVAAAKPARASTTVTPSAEEGKNETEPTTTNTTTEVPAKKKPAPRKSSPKKPTAAQHKLRLIEDENDLHSAAPATSDDSSITLGHTILRTPPTAIKTVDLAAKTPKGRGRGRGTATTSAVPKPPKARGPRAKKNVAAVSTTTTITTSTTASPNETSPAKDTAATPTAPMTTIDEDQPTERHGGSPSTAAALCSSSDEESDSNSDLQQYRTMMAKMKALKSGAVSQLRAKLLHAEEAQREAVRVLAEVERRVRGLKRRLEEMERA